MQILSPFLRVYGALIFFFGFSSALIAQVSCDPVFPKADDNVTIYYDATQGNGALAGISPPIYAHMGLVTSQSKSPTDWKLVPTTWGIADAKGLMETVGPNLYKKTFNIRTFFNVPANETVKSLAFVFRNASGNIVGRSAEGADMFYPVYPNDTKLLTTFVSPGSASQIVTEGASIYVNAAASKTADLILYDNGQIRKSRAQALSLKDTIKAEAGLHQIKFVAQAGLEKDSALFTYVVPGATIVENPPAGAEMGISKIGSQSARFVLYAPKKQLVYIVGDFNNWQAGPAYQMKRGTDGATWWIELNDLPADQPIRFQYIVDGKLRIADPLSTLILDAGNDNGIQSLTYPNMPAYPTGKTSGFVSVFELNPTPFVWQANDYKRPAKASLTIYELLLRDFIARHDYQTLQDTLDYLQNLGVNAIELMPINEFGGNRSWGYNPDFHKALDKYYGSPTALKRFVDECHKRNIAVIVDVVFNHITGGSPLAQLYWDAAANRPAADNPWLNPTPRHDFNVFNDMNHESAATKAYVKNCLKYWIEEFKVDGFRFDLSKGFTQKTTIGNVGAWGQYDASRVATWKDYSKYIWNLDPDFYVILEHFADNNEEKELAEAGMMLWGNMFFSYKELALGFAPSTNISGISYKQRGWSTPHLVGYMESHDEDRIAYECKTYGNSVVANYNIKTLPIAMRRVEMLNNLLYTVPGPKMLWQFGELGYDFPINYCPDGSINANCRISDKPIRWDYFNDPYRRRLYKRTAALLQLRNKVKAFQTANFQANLSSGVVRTIYLNDNEINAAIAVNVATSTNNATLTFQHSGKWYEYYSGATLDVPANQSATITLAAGEYRIYLDQFVPLPAGLETTDTPEQNGSLEGLRIAPNPVDDVCAAAFTLHRPGLVRVEVYDALGRFVSLAASQRMEAGDQQVQLRTGDWRPGMYHITLRDETGGVLTKRLIKISKP